ncbi:MAG TPA: alanine--tRNA ligase-related protein, partial [Candidatus Limnocylindria bacterium]|nr:alanine--tRNA ligase-related protein [Candidatus Limnocylindria bacterium]
MTSAQIRQSFLDFFRSKQHTIVPSSSLMPDSPNLLFTNAGMNQFVPIFLGERKADVSKWAGAVPALDTRAADTQKCIRAGGKHNDLDDVGLDTYHHTFFEMLGNWSFGDYFKQDAIAWAWELVVEVWKFPPQRVYATIYQPNKEKNDPADRDQEAWELWAAKFRSVGLDPDIHIVNGGKKDNFWMMGETGPCGPCTEIHIDLRPGARETSVEEQQSGAKLVNGSDARCIEIWNNVFIQYNANPDGTFTPLPAQHVDTGMGFERVTSIIQGTKGLTDFQNAKISNYETDIFRPIFDEIEKLSGKTYGSTLPKAGSTGDTEQEKIDVAFRVIADHIRTLSFSIGDEIEPGNGERNYVLRRILRRAVRYGRVLGFKEPFFYKLVGVLSRTMGDVFPEVRAKQKQIEEVIKREEESFNRTLDAGLQIFDQLVTLHEKFGKLSAIVKPAVDRLAKALIPSNAKET